MALAGTGTASSQQGAAYGRTHLGRRPLQRQVVQPIPAGRAAPGEAGAQGQDAPAAVQLGRGLHPEPHDRTAARLGRDRLRGVPDGRRVREGRPLEPGQDASVRDHRLSGADPAVLDGQGQAHHEERHRPDLRSAGVRLSRRAHGGAHGEAAGRPADHRRGRRHQDPAGRRLDRRLQGLRPAGEQGHQGAHRLLAGLRRVGQVQGRRREPDRAGGEGCSSRSPVSAASARSRPPTRRTSGASASTSTSTRSRATC